jgi:hypothetical protein
VEIRLSAEQELFAEVAAGLAAGLASRWQLGRGPDSVEAYRLRPISPAVDLTRAVTTVGPPQSAAPLIELRTDAAPDTADRVRAFALVTVAADLLGVMQGALDTAVDHARTREPAD